MEELSNMLQAARTQSLTDDRKFKQNTGAEV